MKELYDGQQTYEMLHASADRLALEAARNVSVGKEADCFIEAYTKVLGFLISKYEKHNPQP